MVEFTDSEAVKLTVHITDPDLYYYGIPILIVGGV